MGRRSGADAPLRLIQVFLNGPALRLVLAFIDSPPLEPMAATPTKKAPRAAANQDLAPKVDIPPVPGPGRSTSMAAPSRLGSQSRHVGRSISDLMPAGVLRTAADNSADVRLSSRSGRGAGQTVSVTDQVST